MAGLVPGGGFNAGFVGVGVGLTGGAVRRGTASRCRTKATRNGEFQVGKPFGEDDESAVDAARRALTEQFQREDDQAKNFDGYKLQDLLQEKWGKSYDIQLKGTPWINGTTLVTVNIMWRYLEQQSFPLTTEDYLSHLEAITMYLKKWNSVDHFIKYVRETKKTPRVAKAVAVPIDLSPEMQRSYNEDMES